LATKHSPLVVYGETGKVRGREERTRGISFGFQGEVVAILNYGCSSVLEKQNNNIGLGKAQLCAAKCVGLVSCLAVLYM
jgi:hypothetical protein